MMIDMTAQLAPLLWATVVMMFVAAGFVIAAAWRGRQTAESSIDLHTVDHDTADRPALQQAA